MDNKQKLLNLLGLAQKAGKLVSGEDFTIDAVKSGRAKLVFVASDAGVNTSKKVHDKSAFYEVEVYDELSFEDISSAIGKNRKVIAVQDKGFAKAMKKLF
ncbi:MAG: YlxQ-related RNA-binding protein [Lactobacillales bacterium]|jgi:ribosomal protein L7Ae-like RNA K-turn-binding protein|nr:YlxQ-related RNA-binding protein [Lactobacillales bacterium]